MTTRPDVVVPASLPPLLRQVITAVYQRLRNVEADIATLQTRIGSVAGRTVSSTTVVSGGSTGSSMSAIPVVDLTTDTALTTKAIYLCDETGGSFTVTLPTAIGKRGQMWYFLKVGGTANTVTLQPDGTETINGDTDLLMAEPEMSITLFSDDANWRIL